MLRAFAGVSLLTWNSKVYDFITSSKVIKMPQNMVGGSFTILSSHLKKNYVDRSRSGIVRD